jgi:hypothetical protein
MTAAKIVRTLQYSIIIAKPAKMQNDLRAIMEEAEPKKKATALVSEVIVMEGPA